MNGNETLNHIRQGWHAAGALAGALLVLYPAPPTARGAEPLSLDSAIRTALARNASLAYEALGVERQRLGVTSAAQDFDLEISPEASLSSSDGSTDWTYGIRAHQKTLWGTEIGIGPEITHYPSVVDDNWRSAIKLDVRQPLFRGFGRLVNEESVTLATERLRAEERQWETQKADLILSVVRSFESILRLQKQAECDRAILERMGRLRELTRIRERQGRASRVDTLRGDLLCGQARSRQETHREEMFSATRELAELLGLEPADTIDLIATPLPDLEVPEIESAIRTALSNRLDFAQTIADCRTAGRQTILARKKLEPDIALTAETRQYGDASSLKDSFTLDENLVTVGLAGQMDLLQHQARTGVMSSDLDLQAARQAVRIKARSIAREVQLAVSAYRQSRAEFAMAGKNLESARARAELSRRLFEMGRGDNFAASDAENAHVDAESALLSARARVCVAGYDLLRILGTLTEVSPSLKPNLSEALL